MVVTRGCGLEIPKRVRDDGSDSHPELVSRSRSGPGLPIRDNCLPKVDLREIKSFFSPEHQTNQGSGNSGSYRHFGDQSLSVVFPFGLPALFRENIGYMSM